LSINYRSVRALCDTGASRSCISERFLKRLKMRTEPLSAIEPKFLYSANQSKIHSCGTVELNVALQGLVIPFQFMVLRDLNYDAILGMDFLTSTHAMIDCAQRLLTLYDGLVAAPLIQSTDKQHLLCLTRSVTIPARTEMMVPVKVPYRHRRQLGIVEVLPQIKNKMVGVAAALVQPHLPVTACRVINLADSPRYLRDKTPIGIISALDLKDPFNIAAINEPQTPTEQSIACDQEIPPEHAERVCILNEIGLSFKDNKLTDDEFEQLTKLIYRYHVFCTNNLLTRFETGEAEPPQWIACEPRPTFRSMQNCR
jgi:hypothetical protein